MMTATLQAAEIIRDALRQAAKECDCKPSEALRAKIGNKAAIAARNIAVRLAYDQGIPRPVLAEAFGRSVKTIGDALLMSRPE
jgi:hypothetical protein